MEMNRKSSNLHSSGMMVDGVVVVVVEVLVLLVRDFLAPDPPETRIRTRNRTVAAAAAADPLIMVNIS